MDLRRWADRLRLRLGAAAVGLLLGGILTQYLSWRWCFYVNLIFAAIAVAGALMLLENHPSEEDAHLDVPGTVLATGGLGVNASQQVGGSIGVALLSTISAGAISSQLAGLTTKPTPADLLAADVHGYTTCFYWAGRSS